MAAPTSSTAASVSGPKPDRPASSSPFGALRVALSAVGAALLGLAPHLLHHAGPLAGAALIGGIGGTLLFGAVGFLLAVPFLLRLYRHQGSWRLPAVALALFVAMFLLSAFLVGPAITDSNSDDGGSQTQPQSQETAHEAHH